MFIPYIFLISTVFVGGLGGITDGSRLIKWLELFSMLFYDLRINEKIVQGGYI